MSHTPGPWFIWQERAMDSDGISEPDLSMELAEMGEHSIFAGHPTECDNWKGNK